MWMAPPQTHWAQRVTLMVLPILHTCIMWCFALLILSALFKRKAQKRLVYGNMIKEIGSVGRSTRSSSIYTSSVTNIGLLYTKPTTLNLSIRFLAIHRCWFRQIIKNTINPFQTVFFLDGWSGIIFFFQNGIFFFKMGKKVVGSWDKT